MIIEMCGPCTFSKAMSISTKVGVHVSHKSSGFGISQTFKNTIPCA